MVSEMSVFDFKDEDALGKVAYVDTSSVVVDVENIENLRRLKVNHLAVLRSSRAGQHLVGVITQVTRKRGVDDVLDDEDEIQKSELNICRIALIGTMLDRDGGKKNVFRRTLESVPEIDASCFSLEGDALTGFMRVISDVSADGRVLKLGKYSLDENAIAYLNGNKFFQRHAFIGGRAISRVKCNKRSGVVIENFRHDFVRGLGIQRQARAPVHQSGNVVQAGLADG